MSDYMTVGQVQAMAQPGPIPGVTGIATFISDRKTGTGTRGAWSVQNITLHDPATNKTIKVKVWDQPEVLKTGTNHALWISAGTGKRAGTTVGLETRLDEYEGKTSRIIWANGRVTLTFHRPEGAVAPVATATTPAMSPDAAAAEANASVGPDDSDYLPKEEPQPTQPAPAPRSGPITHGTPPDPKTLWSKTEHMLAKYRRAYVQCVVTAKEVEDDCRILGKEIPAGNIQELATTFFIQLTRDGGMLHVPDVDHPSVPKY